MRSSPDEDRGRPGIASITKYIPHDSIPHAGGQYLWRHCAGLSPDYRITLIAPDTADNRASRERSTLDADVRLVEGTGLFRGGRLKPIADIESAWAGSAATRNVRRAFQSGAAPWDVLGEARLIEFQWSEMMSLAPVVRRRLPGTPLVGIAHDVITQRWERAAEAARWPVSQAYRWGSRRSRPREATSFGVLDLLIVFSEKDAALARALAPRTRVEVVHPGLGPEPGSLPPRAPDPAAPVVLFTGALNRGDNHAAVVWFLNRVWPAVRSAMPTARFVAAGAHPRPELERLVAQTPRAELTGFVDSLEPLYAGASVVVVPLATGAGVKFKTIDAMLRGIPVVATPVGAEGIDAPELFSGIETDPAPFADAVVQALRDDRGVGGRAQLWADGVYGAETFRRRIRGLYAELIADSRRTT